MKLSESELRFKQFEKLKAEAAELLSLPADHQKVVLLAGLKLEHTRQLEMLVAGDKTNPHELLAVSEAIEKLIRCRANRITSQHPLANKRHNASHEVVELSLRRLRCEPGTMPLAVGLRSFSALARSWIKQEVAA